MSPKPKATALFDTNELRSRYLGAPPRLGPGGASYRDISAKALELAELLSERSPPGREQALAHTKLEEAVMWAHRALDRRGTPQ